MSNSWKEFFTFSHREQGGIIVLLLILLALIGLNFAIPFIISENDYETEEFSRHITLFLAEIERQDSIILAEPVKNKAGDQYAEAKSKLRKFLEDPFTFDPNKADNETMIKTGMDMFAVKNLMKYREKGGTIKTHEDIRKIYGISEDWFEAISPFIKINNPDKDNSSTPAKDAKAAEKETGYDEQYPIYLSRFPIELNQADSAQLTFCTGIGQSFSRRIILYREMLGGFYDKRQLLEVYGMDSVRLSGFQHQVSADPHLVRKMNLDSISFKELLSHPYFEFYMVKAIFDFKAKKKGIDSVEQLRTLPEIFPETYDKISPYLTVTEGKKNNP